MVRSRFALVLLLPLALLLMAFHQLPLVNPAPIAVPARATPQQVYTVITKVLARFGWVVSSDKPGAMEATYAPRDFTVRIGITAAYAGGRPMITVNSWSSSLPAASSQPSSRSLTIGTYRGNNALYTFAVPASAFVTGTNTMTITAISGSSGSGFLSPGYSYDCVELF